MKKRRALFLDGTWNDPDDGTNVRALHDQVINGVVNGTEQVPYYRKGVGTDRFKKLIGGAVGASERFEDPETSVKICARAFELFVRQAREAQINSEFPAFGRKLFKRALGAGYGEEEAGAVIKVLRGAAEPLLAH